MKKYEKEIREILERLGDDGANLDDPKGLPMKGKYPDILKPAAMGLGTIALVIIVSLGFDWYSRSLSETLSHPLIPQDSGPSCSEQACKIVVPTPRFDTAHPNNPYQTPKPNMTSKQPTPQPQIGPSVTQATIRNGNLGRKVQKYI
ncbi:MAG: hypothetical protein WCJ19_02730 [bacterium]